VGLGNLGNLVETWGNLGTARVFPFAQRGTWGTWGQPACFPSLSGGNVGQFRAMSPEATPGA
jgi:hypothetical protein